MLKNEEPKEKEAKTRPWTDQDKINLINQYLYKSDKELCRILQKTSGQLRGMKERLGLNKKINLFTDEEKTKIINFYNQNSNELDLDNFAKELGRPKTSISRYANKMCLTRRNRPLREESLKKSKSGLLEYMKTSKYINEVKENQKQLLAYYANNNHPRGMLNKHHSDSAKAKMSLSHIKLAENMSFEEKHQIAMKAVSTRRKNGGYYTTENAYSRCKGGFRKDVKNYFRSSWEANIARLLNHLNIEWRYEFKRFNFNNETSDILSYQPDFYLPYYNKWVEIKGWMDDNSKRRLQLFEQYYPEEYLNFTLIGEKEYRLLENKFINKIANWE